MSKALEFSRSTPVGYFFVRGLNVEADIVHGDTNLPYLTVEELHQLEERMNFRALTWDNHIVKPDTEVQKSDFLNKIPFAVSNRSTALTATFEAEAWESIRGHIAAARGIPRREVRDRWVLVEYLGSTKVYDVARRELLDDWKKRVISLKQKVTQKEKSKYGIGLEEFDDII